MSKLRNFARPIPFDVEYLKECLNYNPETGVFTWKARPYSHFSKTSTANQINSRFSGKRAGSYQSLKNLNYRAITINYEGVDGRYLEHRLAWFYMTGSDADFQIDHINGIKDDNRWCNLRRGDVINLRNKKQYSNNTSGVNGIHWDKKSSKWVARLAVDTPEGKSKRVIVARTQDRNEAVRILKEAQKVYGYDPFHGKSRER